MKFDLFKIITFLLNIFFFIIFFYVIIKTIDTADSFFSIYTIYLTTIFLLIIFWIYILFTKNKTIRILSNIYFFAILIPIYGFEIFQNYPQFKLIFEDFDMRTKKNVYKDVSKKKKIVPTVPIGYDIINNDNFNFFPLSGIPNKYTLFCNETGKYIFYDSDRYGFRNNDNTWDKKIDAILLGDSFAHGACVENSISKNLNSIQNFNLINLGYQGNGPLKMYGSLKEYGIDLKPKYILWMYDAFNDLDDLIYEMSSPILNQYFIKDYKQNLKKFTNDINDSLNQVINKKMNSDSNRKLSHTIKLYRTRNMIINLFNKNKHNYNYDNEFEKFKIIFENTIQLATEIESDIIFIFFADIGYLKEKDYTNHDKKILEYISSKNIQVINIAEIMKKTNNFNIYFPFDGAFGHFNERGYRLVSDEIEKLLIKK